MHTYSVFAAFKIRSKTPGSISKYNILMSLIYQPKWRVTSQDTQNEHNNILFMEDNVHGSPLFAHHYPTIVGPLCVLHDPTLMWKMENKL